MATPPQPPPYVYESPLATRYASSKVSELFSTHTRYKTWREIWIALAQAQQQLGLPISDEQIHELQTHINDIDFTTIAQYEKTFKHDVMANIHAYGDLCPQAKSIIHLGATSCTITDNADLIIMRSALTELRHKLHALIASLREKAIRYKDLPCLGFTHGQVAQPTTVGKRIAGWLQDFVFDYKQIQNVIDNLQFLGIKGATGTQASFLQLLDGDHEKVNVLERLVAEHLGFSYVLPISGQTYTRKQDVSILNVICDSAISAHKMATDIRLLSSMKELQEPFGSSQVGSSAMPYKRNPMKCERICSLARYIMSVSENPKYTASIQWFERTLDDSANRRLCIPESFLAADGIIRLLIEVTNGLVVNENRIAYNVARELPFLSIEAILMHGTQKGADRQALHECIREHSMATYTIMEQGGENDLFERIAQDERIPIDKVTLQSFTADQFIGRAPQQVEQFVAEYVDPLMHTDDMHHYHDEQIAV